MSDLIIEQVKPGTIDAFSLYGGNLEAFNSREKEIFLVGPSDSGKTLSLCAKMHFFALKYPGAQILFCRKSQTALRQTGVKTFKKVLKMLNMEDNVRLLGESRPSAFIYPYNELEWDGRTYRGKSEITISPIDGEGNALGGEYDFIFVSQPDTGGLTLDEYQLVSSRANGRAGNTPYFQVVSDPNPAHERHWILQEALKGRWEIIPSTHQDNPRLYNHETDEWTIEGQASLAKLDALSGTDRERLFLGKWFSVEGLLLGEYWNESQHSFSLSDIHRPELQGILTNWEARKNWDNYLVMDFGWDHPFCAALWCKVPEQDLYIRHSLVYRSGHTTPENAKLVKEMIYGFNVKDIVIDRNPNEQAIMEQIIGRRCQVADKRGGSVESGWNILIDELKNGRLLYLNIDEALFQPERCPIITDRKGPHGFQEEVMNLRKDPRNPGGIIKEGDEEADCSRYLFSYLKVNQTRKPTVIWI